jgi:hypothetical protein
MQNKKNEEPKFFFSCLGTKQLEGNWQVYFVYKYVVVPHKKRGKFHGGEGILREY